MKTYEQIMYNKILTHANCKVEVDMNYPDEQYISAVEISNYNDGENVAIECVKCNEVIIDFNHPEETKEEATPSFTEQEVMLHAYRDIDFLLQEGFDTNVDDCEMDGVKDTIKELKKYIEVN